MTEFTNKQLDVADLPKLEALEYSGLHKNHLTETLIIRGFVGVVAVVALYFGTMNGNLSSAIFALLFAAEIAVIVAFIWFGYLGFFKKGFALREKDVSYKRGIIFQTITTIPLSRIQHSEVVRGPLDRFFGLSSVKIYTAGGNSSDVVIPGLALENAEKVREFINAKIADNASE